jgi:hypothetical protein
MAEPVPAAAPIVPMDESAAPPAVVEETATAPKPECESAEDCLKGRGDAPGGSEWVCESNVCVTRALPEPPKADAAVETPKSSKSPKKGNRSRKGN